MVTSGQLLGWCEWRWLGLISGGLELGSSWGDLPRLGFILGRLRRLLPILLWGSSVLLGLRDLGSGRRSVRGLWGRRSVRGLLGGPVLWLGDGLPRLWRLRWLPSWGWGRIGHG